MGCVISDATFHIFGEVVTYQPSVRKILSVDLRRVWAAYTDFDSVEPILFTDTDTDMAYRYLTNTDIDTHRPLRIHSDKDTDTCLMFLIHVSKIYFLRARFVMRAFVYVSCTCVHARFFLEIFSVVTSYIMSLSFKFCNDPSFY